MNKIWLTWHDSQRSRNLANDFNASIIKYVNENGTLRRHLLSSIWTCFILLKHRPKIIYLQYSFLLLLIVSTYKLIHPLDIKVICDCHTKALRRKLENKLAKLFWLLKRFSFAFVDISIISNEGLINDLKSLMKNYEILPDKIPDLRTNISSMYSSTEDNNFCVFVCSYSVDEPLNEVIKAAEIIDGLARVICTGKIPKNLYYLKNQPLKNIFFTDYLIDTEYNNLLAEATCVLTLTNESECLQCAGYEALALNIPIVTSRTKALISYFEDSAIYVDNKANEIAEGIKRVIAYKQDLKIKMAKLKVSKNSEYEMKMNFLRKRIENM